jgi:serine/threonine-protein kinase RsbW
LKPLGLACHNRQFLSDVELSLGGDLKELERLAVWIRQFCEQHSLNEDVDFRLNLVLEELFTNAVRHGGCKGVADAVSIRLRPNGPEIVAEYSDRGRPFDPSDASPPDLTASLEERRVGGLGLHFVRQMTRYFEYHRVDERNLITMRLAI